MTATLSRPHAPLQLCQAYATGALGPASSIAVGIHMETCAVCKSRIAELEAIGGAMLERETPEEAIDTTLDAMLARLDAVEASAPPITCPPEAMRVAPSLRQVVAAALSRGRWGYAGPGLRTLNLAIPGADAFDEQPQLLRIEPGYGAPRHGHGRVELTLVLEGAFRDEAGRYGPGDLAIARPGLTHRPVAEPGQTCLAYAVSHAPMRFTGLLGLAQWLLTPRA